LAGEIWGKAASSIFNFHNKRGHQSIKTDNPLIKFLILFIGYFIFHSKYPQLVCMLAGILNLDSFGVLSASMCSPKKNDSFPAGRIRGLIQALCRCLETALYDAQLI